MGNIIFPAPTPTYTINRHGPPFYMVEGVPCLWFNNLRPKSVIIYFHCNGVDLGIIKRVMYRLSRETSSIVICPEYPGYGSLSHLNNSLRNVTNYTRRVYEYASKRFKNKLPIITIGRSIGSAVCMQVLKELSPEIHPQIIVLISPFSDLGEAAKTFVGCWGSTMISMTTQLIFNTKQNASHIKSPLIVIHGKKDDLFGVNHSKTIITYSSAEYKKLYIMPDSDHNDIDWNFIFQKINYAQAYVLNEHHVALL